VDQAFETYVKKLPVFDVHEHHMPETVFNKEFGLIQLFEQSYASWSQNRWYPLPGEAPKERTITPVGQGRWKDLAEYVEKSGNNTFVRNIIWALRDLFDLGDEGITENNWKEIDQQLQQRRADDTWFASVLDRAYIKQIIADAYTHPLMDAHQTFGERYHSVLRINALAMGWHPQNRDHNGNCAGDFAKQLGCKVETFDDYMDMLQVTLDTMPDRHQVALKNALAYDRSLNFDDIDEKIARQAWGKTDPSDIEKKAFGDVVVDRLCSGAGQRNIPVQMHLGAGQIRVSHPMNAAGLIERHPGTRFLLMHLAYPWYGDLFGLAFVYRNIWVDLTWSWLLSPTRFKNAFHEAIEVLADESRLMLGGDCWHAEESYGTIMLAKKLIGEALSEKVQSGYFKLEDAKRLARKIFHQNAATFFKINTVQS